MVATQSFPPPPVGAPSTSERPRPSAAGYVVGGLVIVAGAVLAVVWFVAGLRHLETLVDGFERYQAPGTYELVVGHTRSFTIYTEGTGPVSVSVTDPTGADVLIDDYSGELTYDFGSRSGRAFATFRASRLGTYELHVAGSGTIAVGDSVGPTLVRSLFGLFGIGGAGLVLGVIIIAITAMRRGRAKPRPTWPAGPWPSPPNSSLPPPPGVSGWGR